MNRLLKLQLRNIFHNKLFYICLAISLLLSIGFTFIGEIIVPSTSKVTFMSQVIDILSSSVDIIGMIFIVVFCSYDFSEGTTKNIVGRGYTKVQVLFSKYIASLIGIVCMDLILIILSFVLFIKNGFGYEEGMILIIIIYLFKMVAYTVMYATVTFILEKTSSSVITCLFVPQIIMVALIMADSSLKLNVSSYWIDNVDSKLISHPLVENMIFPTIMYIMYILLFIFVGIYFSKNKEIK